MKKARRLVGSMLSAVLLISGIPMSASAAAFSDVPGTHWAYGYIEEMAKLEIIQGYEGRFYPDDNIIRGDVAVILDRVYNFSQYVTEDEGNGFVDLPTDAYYYEAVMAANALGFMLGDGDYVRPEDKITREEYVAMLDRVFVALDLYEQYEASHPVCSDYDSISGWAQAGVERMMKIGLVEGDENFNFNPQHHLTRAEISTITYRSIYGEKAPEVDVEWAAAYLAVAEELIARYGMGAVSSDTPWGEYLIGAAIIRLIDFDGDGVPELYCAYQREGGIYVDRQVVYSYDNGLVSVLEEMRVSNPGTDVSPEVTFLTKDNVVYLVDAYEIRDGAYYTLQGGRMIPVFQYFFDLWEDGGGSTVNGEPVSYEELMAAIEAFEAGGVRATVRITGGDTDALVETRRTIDQLRALAS